MSEQWRISKEEYDVLVSYIGCGNFSKADVIIFGNEEGTGGNSVEANVKARYLYYGKNENGEYEHCLDDDDWKKGFWDLSSNTDDNKVKRYLEENEEPHRQEDYTSGSFLSTIARICLATENQDFPLDYWFASYPSNRDAEREIKYYIVNNLFKKTEGIQTGLVDWRPLPRPKQDWWGEEYRSIYPDGSVNNPYLAAFDRRKNINASNLFSNFIEDREKRKKILKNAFSTFPAKIVISLGGVAYKKAILEEMYDSIKFTSLDQLSVDIGNLKSYKGGVQLEDKNLFFFLLPFPAAGNVFENGDVMLQFFKEFTEIYARPLLQGKNIELNKERMCEDEGQLLPEHISQNEGEAKMRIVQSADEIETYEVLMVEQLKLYSDFNKAKDSVEKGVETTYIKLSKLGFWCVKRKLIKERKWWNSFGLEIPALDLPNTELCEVNAPFEGINNHIQGAFIEIEGKIFLTHRGKITGLSKDFVHENYQGDKLMVDGNERIVVGEVTSSQFAIQIKAFLDEVKRLKEL